MLAPRVPTPERWLSACASPPYSTRHRPNLRASGEYPLQAQRLGFETVTTEALELHGNNIVDVVIRMSSEAMALDPLEVIGRGGSENQPSHLRRALPAASSVSQCGDHTNMGAQRSQDGRPAVRPRVSSALPPHPPVSVVPDTRHGHPSMFPRTLAKHASI